MLPLYALLVAAAHSATGQTPMYFKTGTGTTGNTIPLNQTSQKTQLLYTPSDFQMTPLSGSITKIYFRNSAAAATGTFTDFQVNFLQNTATAFVGTSFFTGLTPALSSTSFTVTGNATAGGWFEIPLPAPYFSYSNAQTLIVEIQYSAKTGGISTTTSTSTGNKRCSGTSQTATTGTTNTTWNDFGMDVMSTSPCTSPPTPGITTASVSGTVCPGTPIVLGLSGASQGTGQTYVWESAPQVAGNPGAYTALGASTANGFFSTTASATQYYRASITCGASTVTSTPVLVTVSSVLAGGTYTINNALPTAGANFNAFSDAASAIQCGITGPVVFDVVNNATPYSGQFSLPNISGTSATNTITFNGNGATLNFSTSNANQRAGILLNGTDYVRIKRLNIVSQMGSTYAYGIHLTNDADNNTIDSCTIYGDTVGSTAASFAGIAVSGSLTSPITAGSGCDSVRITNNFVNGGYYGITLMGAATQLSNGNLIARNTVQNFHFYGIYNGYTNATSIDQNDVSRPTRTTFSTFNGIYVPDSSTNLRITRNRIHDPATALTSSASAAYGIYHTGGDASATAPCEVSNNLIYNFKTEGVVYGIYNVGSNYIRYYYNTVSLDDQASTTTDATRGFAQLTTAAVGLELKNNIFSVTRGNPGAKYAVYFGVAATTYAAQTNVYYVPNPGAGGIAYYNATTYTAAQLATYQAASSQDAGTVTANPAFTSLAGNDYTPATTAINNIGTPVGVTIDIFGNPRSTTTPDPGAIEFNYTPCTAPPTAGVTLSNAIAGSCPGATVSFSLSGNSVGSGQTYQLEVSSALAGTYAPVGTSTAIPTASAVTPATAFYRFAVTCGTSTTYSTPVQVLVDLGLAGGTYTINNAAPASATNFPSFTAAVSALQCGVLGPVVFNVVANAAPYNEQFSLPNLIGTSATNTVTFNGNGATLTFNTTVSGQRAVVTLNGADWVRIKRLNIISTGITYGVGVQMINDANNNVVDSCNISVDTAATGTAFGGIIVSGSLTSATTTGSNCDSLTLTNNSVYGGYYGIVLLGSATQASSGNLIKGNKVTDFYDYGVYGGYVAETVIDSNDVSRPTRTEFGAFYGVYIPDASSNLRITRNRIHNPAGGLVTATDANYCIYHSAADAPVTGPNIVANNLIYDCRSAGLIYAIYNNGSDNVKYYHNTVSLDDATSATAAASRGFFQSAAAVGIEIKNNIFSVTRSGTGAKHGIYWNTAITATNPFSARSNVYYVANPGTTGGVAYYNLVTYPTVSAYQAASLQDTGSVDVNPVFTSVATNNYLPTSANVNDIGVPIPQVPLDILGNARSTTAPDPGILEFTPGGCVAPPTAGVVTASDTVVCSGSAVIFSLSGNSQGLNQTYVWETSPTLTGTYTAVSTASALPGYTQAVTTTTYFRAAVTCSGITSYSTPRLVTVTSPLAGGTYTINAGAAASASNFQSFGTAVQAMSCGILGPVVVNVVANSGPYNEQVIFPNTITGVSATNTITFNGNGNVLTFNSTNTNSRAGIRFDGADWITINNLTITATGTYGFGVQMISDADHNTIRGCTINLDTNSTSTNYAGLVISGTLASATGTASNCDSNRFLNNFVNGGYYGMTSIGATTQQVSGNVMRGNTLRNYYFYGSYHTYNTGLLVDSNNFSRPTRTTLTTFYGVFLTTGNIASMVSRNRIHNPCGGNLANTSQVSGVYVAADGTVGQENMVVNNLIYNFNGQGVQYGLYNATGANARFLHNTVSLDDTTSTTTAVTRGFYQTGATTGIDVRNNIFSLRRTGSGVKTALYFGTATTTFTSNFNDLYVTGGTGANNIGFLTSAYTTLPLWQAGTSKDSLSVDFNPQFAGGATGGNLTPTNFSIDNLGQAIGVTVDAFGSPRSTTSPDLGAIEFTVVPPCGVPTFLLAANVTSTSATLFWTAPATAPTGYQYVVSTTNTTPTGAGTSVVAPPVTVTNLTPGATYYYFVRSECSPGNFSGWVRDSFTTCIAPTATLTAVGTTAICQGDSVILKGNGGTGFTYQFLKDGVSLGTAAGDSILYATQAGNYTVIVTNAAGCFDTSGSVLVTVNPLPLPVVTPVNAVTITTTTFAAYQWLLGGNAIAGATNQSYTASQNGLYSVRVTDANGCVGTSAPYNLTTTSVGGASGAAAVQVFPNPTTGILFISSKAAVNASVWTMDGRKLTDVADAKTVDLQGLPAGVYILRLADANGTPLLTERVTKLD